MRRLWPALAGVAVALGGVAGLALAAAGGPRPSGPCERVPGTPVVAGTSELGAGNGVWTAWTPYPVRPGETVTVQWRVQSGEPDAAISGRSADGTELEVGFGPQPVFPTLSGAGRFWERFGREWGAQVRFPSSGCWHLTVEGGGRRGELTVLIEAA